MRVCIFGLPKTGTTGLYGLIKNGMVNSGLNPVATFEPPGQGAFKAFFEKSTPDVNFVTKVMIRKIYFEDPKVIDQFSHKVMIVRDPRDRAISRLLFRALGKRMDDRAALDEFVDLLRQKEADPSSISFVGLTKEADRLGIGKSEWSDISSRMEYQISCLENHGFHRVLYEDFVAKNYSDLSEYLGIELEGNQAKNESWLGHITRSKSNGAWRDWYTQEDVEFIRPIFKPYMDHFGYEDDWSIPEKQTIASKTASEYVVDRYAKRAKEFSLMSSGAEKSTKSKEDLKFYLGRAGDGRNADIWLVASDFLKKGEKDEAFKWFETGHLLGNLKCQKAIRRLLKLGYRPEEYRTKFSQNVLKMLAKKEAAKKEAAEKAAAKKAAAKKAATEKAAAKKATAAAKKSAVKKVPAKTGSGKPTSTKKPPAKKSSVETKVAKTTAAKKTSPKASPTKKVTAKKVPAKSTPAKSTPAKSTPAKKVPVKTASAKKKSPPKKTSTKTTSAKKAPAKKTSVKKASAKS